MVVLCLFERAEKKEETNKYLDLVAIGTVADIVPLTDENRIFTKFGLEQLLCTKHKGLKFLLYKLFSSNKQNIEKTEYTTYDVGFIIAPVFNAAGRLTDAKMVVKLLTSDNEREIEVIVKELINRNFERKELQNKIVEKIEKAVEKTREEKDSLGGIVELMVTGLEETMTALSDFFKNFGDSTRIKIVSALMAGELCVADIAEVLEISIFWKFYSQCQNYF